jgi:uncharacterized protein YjiS (DUF1127 family)
MSIDNLTRPGRFVRVARLASVLSRVVNRIRHRRQLMSLLDLPDYLLKDIGLQRHQISREGLKWFWEE